MEREICIYSDEEIATYREIAMRRRKEIVNCNESGRKCRTIYNHRTILYCNKSQKKHGK
jgi:hypothetical protein